MDSREIVARFEYERRALALMSHPNIAAVYEAGTTVDGRPFFAMEYVPGEPVTDLLRPPSALHPRAARAVPEDLRRRATRPPEGDHPSRSQAVERAGDASGRAADTEDRRLRTRQGHLAASDRRDHAHDDRRLVGTLEYMSPEQARAHRPRYRHPQRHLLARRAPLQPAGGHRALRQGGAAESAPRRASPDHPRRGPPRPSTRLVTECSAKPRWPGHAARTHGGWSGGSAAIWTGSR